MKHMKKDLFTTVMMIFGSMVGAGLLLVPGRVMHYGFSALCGWIIASICSCVLGIIFSYTAVQDPDNNDTLTVSAQKIYGDLIGFLTAFYQSTYIMISIAAVMCTFVKYFSELFIIENDYLKFILCSVILFIFTFMHAVTLKSFDILKFFTSIKLIFFGGLSILGIVYLNPGRLIGLSEDIIQQATFKDLINGIVANIGKYGITGMLTCSSISLIAFAGLEVGVQDVNSIANPKATLPKATIISLILASSIFIFVYIFTANQVGHITVNTPVKAAIELIYPQYAQYLGKLIAIIASLGCLGTVLALGYIVPGIMAEGYTILQNDHQIYRSCRTNFPVFFGILSTGIIIVIMYCAFFISSGCFDLVSYFIVASYFKGVLIGIHKQINNILSSIAIVACLILLLGCESSQAINFILSNMVASSFFCLFKSNTNKPTMKNIIHNKKEK